jgi:hypothetical protein
MGKERVAFEGFNNCDHAIMATYSQVVSLGNVMSQNHP